MNKHFWTILCVSLFAVLVQAKEFSFNGTKPAAIIDVRTPEEYAAGHIDGALNIPYEQIVNGMRALPRVSKDKPVLVYCRSGRRSAIAAEALGKEGYKRIIDGGGMETLARSLKECSKKTC